MKNRLEGLSNVVGIHSTSDRLRAWKKSLAHPAVRGAELRRVESSLGPQGTEIAGKLADVNATYPDAPFEAVVDMVVESGTGLDFDTHAETLVAALAPFLKHAADPTYTHGIARLSDLLEAVRLLPLREKALQEGDPVGAEDLEADIGSLVMSAVGLTATK